MEIGIYIIVGLIISALLGNYIAKQKGRDTTEGVLFGLFLGILGLIILALLPNKSKQISSDAAKEPPSEKAIQRAKDNDFFSKLIGIILILGIILFIYTYLLE